MGVLPQAPHGTVREPLDSYGSSRKRFQLISGAYTPVGKQTRLHFVQRVEPSAALAQVHPFIPLAPFLQPPVYKASDVVQVTFYKVTVIVLPASYQRVQQIGYYINTTRSGV